MILTTTSNSYSPVHVDGDERDDVPSWARRTSAAGCATAARSPTRCDVLPSRAEPTRPHQASTSSPASAVPARLAVSIGPASRPRAWPPPPPAPWPRGTGSGGSPGLRPRRRQPLGLYTMSVKSRWWAAVPVPGDGLLRALVVAVRPRVDHGVAGRPVRLAALQVLVQRRRRERLEQAPAPGR